MRGSSLRATAALVATLALVAACGSSSGSGKVAGHNESSAAPKTELADAVGALGKGHALTVTLRLNTTAADLIKIDREHGDSGPDAIPTPVANAVTGDHVSFEIIPPAGATIAELNQPRFAKGASFALTLGDSSENYFSLLEVKQSLYAQLDLEYFLGVANNAAQYSAIERQVAQAPAFVRDFIAGKWISLPFSAIQGIEGLAEGELKAKASDLPSQAKIAALRSNLVSTLVGDLTVARPSTGSTDHLVLSATLSTLLADEYHVVKPFIDSTAKSVNPAFVLGEPDFSQLPQITPQVDGYVTNGALTKLSLDIGQFDSKVKYSLPVELDFSSGGASIVAPASATAIDLSSLIQAFLSATPGHSSSGSGTATASPLPLDPAS